MIDELLRERECAGSVAAGPGARTVGPSRSWAHRLAADPALAKTRATLLITDLPELGTTDRKAIASLAGLAPHVTQSGNASPRATIGGGRPCVHAALYLGASSPPGTTPT